MSLSGCWFIPIWNPALTCYFGSWERVLEAGQRTRVRQMSQEDSPFKSMYLEGYVSKFLFR